MGACLEEVRLFQELVASNYQKTVLFYSTPVDFLAWSVQRIINARVSKPWPNKSWANHLN